MKQNYELIILGGGPAGMTAAIYAARAGLQVLLLEENSCGGLVNWTKVVENMPSYISIGGMELVEKMEEQLAALDVDIEEAACIDSLSLDGTAKIVVADDICYTAKSVIIATGRKPKPLEIAGDCEQVHYCAICDGMAYRGKRVLVAGGGNSGFDEAIALLDQGIAELLLVEKMGQFFAAQITQEQLSSRGNASMKHSTEVSKVSLTDGRLHSVTLRDGTTGEEKEHECDGIFVFMGQEPGTEILKNKIHLDDNNYILANELMATSVPGVFAAGDVVQKKYRQITTAMADGTIAALEAERFIRSLEN